MQISTFETKKEAKNWIIRYLMNLHKPFKIERSDKKCYSLICTEPTCNFKFFTSKRKGIFVLHSFVEHSCSESCSRTTSSYIANYISPLSVDFNDSLKPKDSLRHLKNQYGIESNYINAYRALKSHKTENELLDLRKCKLLKPWLEWMTFNNPGSIHDYREKTPVNENLVNIPQVEYCFFMPSASVNAFRKSLPIITLDACHTKGGYKGIIFIATAITGDDKGVILAYAIGPTESHEYWKLFISSLAVGLDLTNKENLVVISDREKGLAQAVREEVPNASHSFCVFHIEKNIKSRFKTDTAGLIWKMAKAQNLNDFNLHMDQLRILKGAPVYNFLNQIDPRFWARPFFPVPRFGHCTSNISESINASLGDEIRKMNSFDIMRNIAQKISDNYSLNFERYSAFIGLYPLKISKKIEKNKLTARTLDLRLNNRSPQIQVQSEPRSGFYKIYNRETKKCSCGYQNEYGVPCQHILAVSLRTQCNELDYVIEARKNETVKQLYNSFILFCDVDELVENNVAGMYMLPRRGRPRRSEARIQSQAETINRRTITCRLCGQASHNSRTCPTRTTNNQNVE